MFCVSVYRKKDQMLYTIGDASRKLGVPASTLRYYDKEGLLPHTNRSGSGMRMFTEDDFEWVRFIERLKLSGMPIKEIKSYIDLYEQGDETLSQRRELIYARRDAVEHELERLQETLQFITYKCWYYDKAVELGSEAAVKAIPIDELPPDIRAIKERCGISRY